MTNVRGIEFAALGGFLCVCSPAKAHTQIKTIKNNES